MAQGERDQQGLAINPEASVGYAGVAAYCAVMLVAFLALAVFIRWVGNVRSAEKRS